MVVVAQALPAKAKLIVAPLSCTGGEAETSIKLAVRVKGTFGAPLAGLRFILRKVVCLPAVQLTRPTLEVTV